MEHIGKLSPVCFGIALICFAMPFITVSCQNQEIARMSGIDTMTGATLDVNKMMGALNDLKPKAAGNAPLFKMQQPSGAGGEAPVGGAQAGPNGLPPQLQNNQIPGSPLAIAAFVCGIVGLGLYFVTQRKNGPVPALLGAASAVLLLIMKTRMENQVQAPTMGMIQVNAEPGFWLSLIAFAAAAAINGYLMTQGSCEPATAGAPSRAAAGHGAPVPRARAYPVFPDGNSADEQHGAVAPPPIPREVPPPRAPIPVAGLDEREPEPAGRR